MNHNAVRERVQSLTSELASIHTTNALHLVRKHRSRAREFRHQERLERLQQIVEELGALRGQTTRNANHARETFAVRFRVIYEPAGPMLSYRLAGPSISTTFASHRFESTTSLINALSDMRLPGREIEAGKNPERIYVVGAAQLEILNLKVPE
jgi:3-methyladenine DNA glycosylase Mpg